MKSSIFHRILGPLVLLAGLSAVGNDWPQWRGPERDGLSREAGLLQEWPADGPALLWQARDLDAGYSTPAVVGDRIYLLSNRGLEDESVRALSVTDGRTLWSTRIGKVGNPDQRPSYPAARSTPTVAGGWVYALGSDGDLACLEASTGKVRWTRQLRTEFGGQPGVWAYSESPLLHGDSVICTPGGAEATLVALSQATGETVWKCAVPGGDQAAYASALVMEAGGTPQVIQMVQKGLVGVDVRTGKFLWRYDRTGATSPANIPTPVADGARIYTGGARVGGGLVEIREDNGAWVPQEVYFSAKLPTAIGGSVRVGSALFGSASQALLCVDFPTGEIKWEERSIAPASLCYADGRLYLHGEDGAVALVEASAEAYRERGRFTPPNGPDRGQAKAWAYPVVANGRLYLRDANSLWCYDVRQP